MKAHDSCSSCGSDLHAGEGASAICVPCAFGFALGDPGQDTGDEPAAPRESADQGAAGGRIGPYRLLRVLGEGGMGIVWEAEQAGPVRRRVALKRVRAGMDSAQILARFESERQALALMSHPNIAQVYDAGRSEDGAPYFAMEYVDGPPITEYCDTHRLDVPGRLELFSEVCRGIQHAHQRGIIHRDIKPSNVLVPTVEGRPVPKIIDFGVAKAVGAPLTDRTLVTRIGQTLGTPEYMSPEQAGPAGFDVDTRTDVYALGVVLYQLLTGRLPFEAPDGDPDELKRRIREEEPARPSARVAGPGAGAAEAARLRGSEPAALARLLRRELDWILIKALAKDRSRRYGSPEELAADLGRYMTHQPVVAGPPSTSYRVARFVRRHRAGVAAGSTIVLLLFGTAVGMTLLARSLALARDRAAKEAATASAALEFLTGIFRVSDPEQSRGATITAREILDRGAADIERSLDDAPDVQAEMMLAIGRTYSNLGLDAQAEPLVRRSLELRRRILGARDKRTHEAATALSSILGNRSSLEEAETLARAALSGLERVAGAGDPSTAEANMQLSNVLVERGRFDEAERHARAALDALTRSHGPDHRDTLRAEGLLSDCLLRLEKFEEAESLFRRTLETSKRIDGEDALSLVSPLIGLADTLRSLDRMRDAEAPLREALAILRRHVGDDHPDTCGVLSRLGRLLLDLRRSGEGEPMLRLALEGYRRQGQEKSPASLKTVGDLAFHEWGLEHYDEAERLYREAHDGFKEGLGADHPQTLRALGNLASVLRSAGRLKEAESFTRQGLEAFSRTLGPTHTNTLTMVSNLGLVLVLQGRHEEALPLLEKTLGEQRKALPARHYMIAQTLARYGQGLAGLRRYAEAEPMLLEAEEGFLSSRGASDKSRLANLDNLVRLYEAWGKPDKAARWRGSVREHAPEER